MGIRADARSVTVLGYARTDGLRSNARSVAGLGCAARRRLHSQGNAIEKSSGWIEVHPSMQISSSPHQDANTKVVNRRHGERRASARGTVPVPKTPRCTPWARRSPSPTSSSFYRRAPQSPRQQPQRQAPFRRRRRFSVATSPCHSLSLYEILTPAKSSTQHREPCGI